MGGFDLQSQIAEKLYKVSRLVHAAVNRYNKPADPRLS